MEAGMLHAPRNAATRGLRKIRFGRDNADSDNGSLALNGARIGGEMAFSKAPARLFPTISQKISD